MKTITINNIEFEIVKNDNTGRSFILQNKDFRFVYSYNTLVYGEKLNVNNFYANRYTNYSATTRKHIYNALRPFVTENWSENGLKTKNGNLKETLISFICRCGHNMPNWMPGKLDLKNIEWEFTRNGDKYVKSIKKGII